MELDLGGRPFKPATVSAPHDHSTRDVTAASLELRVGVRQHVCSNVGLTALRWQQDGVRTSWYRPIADAAQARRAEALGLARDSNGCLTLIT